MTNAQTSDQALARASGTDQMRAATSVAAVGEERVGGALSCYWPVALARTLSWDWRLGDDRAVFSDALTVVDGNLVCTSRRVWRRAWAASTR